jgi:DNA gyrase subunit A
MEGNMAEIKRDITELLEESMGNYSYNTNLFRAFPDVRDGLKPVSRKIIYSMKDIDLYSNKPHKKVASVVGNALGKFYPHGDASITDALVKMAQDFYMNQPLVDGNGNFGSISGDSAAAMRYIECRMTKYCESFLEDIEKNAVDWKDNYDQTLKEPVTLPAKFPNLLINGSYGIGQAYISSIPPHNFSEVIDLTVKLINNPELTVDDIKSDLTPDYPTGGIIINASELPEFYKTGSGVVRLRGKVEHTDKGDLIIREIPYMTTLGAIKDKIQEVIKDERITGIVDLIDETNNKNGVKLLIKIKKGYDSSLIENQLYKYTPLESTALFNLICTEGDTFKIFFNFFRNEFVIFFFIFNKYFLLVFLYFI